MAATVKKSNPQTCVCAFSSQFRRRDGGRDSPQLRDLASDPQIDGRRITVTVSLNGRSIDSVRPVNALYIFEEISIKKKRKKEKGKKEKHLPLQHAAGLRRVTTDRCLSTGIKNHDESIIANRFCEYKFMRKLCL